MWKIARVAMGAISILIGSAFLFRFVQVLVQIGQPQEMKAVAYAMLAPLFSLLPITVGVNLIRRTVSWRLFTSGWLIAWGTLNLLNFLWVMPLLVRIYRLDLSFLAVMATGPVAIFIGILLLGRHMCGARGDEPVTTQAGDGLGQG
jgi:hypothetical protein